MANRANPGGTVLLAVLVVTAMVVPTAAVGESGPPPGPDGSVQAADARLGWYTLNDPAPLERKLTAVETVRNLSAERQRGQARERALRLLEGSLSEYRDDTRVESAAAFRNDSQAVRALARFEGAGEDQETDVEVATRLVVEADAETSATAIDDARRVLNRTGERADEPGALRAATAHLENAQRAYDRGRAALEGIEDESLGTRARQRARAIEQFRIAWRQAQLAIDRLDRATAPRVTIQTRADPFRNGTNATTRRIAGTVEDPRAFELDNATIRVNDGPRRNVSLDASSAPGTNATFETTVNFTQRVTTVNVTVADAPVQDREDGSDEGEERGPGGTGDDGSDDEDGDGDDESDEDDGGNGPPDEAGNALQQDDGDDADGEQTGDEREGEDREESGDGDDADGDDAEEDDADDGSGVDDADDADDEEDADDGDGRQVGRDVLRLDGDRLSDRFETAIVETDPLDPDSDAATTERDEANNGVVDGEETFGNSTLPLFVQERIGADPFTNDTDGDGLTDAFELEQLGLQGVDVGSADADGDGIPDPEEDPDGDGLTNGREQAVGTDPLVADTDGDGVPDRVELERGTDPLVADTDGDGLDDASEERTGTDPLDPDTDGDGVLDGNETYTTRASDQSVGATVEVTGTGDLSETITIAANEGNVAYEGIEASVSPFVELNASGNVTEARVTVEYDGSAVAPDNESDLAIYRFDEPAGTFQRLNSTVDAANDSVSATTTEFSTFVVFRVPAWEANFETPLPSGRGSGNATQTQVDGVFVLDSSGSMSSTDPDGLRRVGAKRFVGALIEGDRAGVVDFDSSARVTQELTTNFTAANASIEAIDSSGGTNIGAGIRAANGEFDRASNGSRGKIMIVLSDGFTFDEAGARAAAEAAAERNVTIYTIGFGNPDDALMQDIAETTGGNYTFVADVNDLPQVFSRIAENATAVQDSDGDGIPDAVEREGIRSGTGEVYYTDPNDPDTDGDGIPDGVEAGPRVGDEYYEVRSDPTEVDSDDDGFTDRIEAERGTDPLDADTDDDGVDDGGDVDPFTAAEPTDSGPSGSELRALVVGAIKGEVGFEGVEVPFGGTVGLSEYRDSPYYLLGWVLASIVPLVDIVADVRDLAANLRQGDGIEAALDAAGLIPIIGKIGDTGKAIKVIAKWVKAFPGKVAKATRLIGKFIVNNAPTGTYEDIYSALGKGSDYRRLVTDGGLTDDALRQLVRNRLTRINNVDGSKLSKPLTISDVDEVFGSPGGRVFVLIKTNKWKNIDEVAKRGPGFVHVVARHANPKTSSDLFDDFPVSPGQFSNLPKDPPGGATLFPPGFGPSEIKSAIRATTESSGRSVTTRNGKRIITYSGPNLDPRIDDMTVIVAEDSGKIITAFPSKP